MKQLSSFMSLEVNGGDRISYTYDVINDKTGEPVSTNNKASFYALDSELKAHITAIRNYIRNEKLAE